MKKEFLKECIKLKNLIGYKKTKIQLLGSGTILREMMAAAEVLQDEYQIDSEIWSVTSFNELRKDGMEVERYNLLNPDKEQKSFICRTMFRKNRRANYGSF